MKHIRNYFAAAAAVIGLILIDQLTKVWAVWTLKDQQAIVLWEGVFELRYLENSGAAFGIFQNQTILFSAMTIVIVVLLIWFYVKLPKTRKYVLLQIPTILCIAGAIGNFIDRIRHSYVVDFFYFKLIDFPIFNVADICITCSVALFLLVFLFVYKEEDFAFLSKNRDSDTGQRTMEAEGSLPADDPETEGGLLTEKPETEGSFPAENLETERSLPADHLETEGGFLTGNLETDESAPEGQVMEEGREPETEGIPGKEKDTQTLSGSEAENSLIAENDPKTENGLIAEDDPKTEGDSGAE